MRKVKKKSKLKKGLYFPSVFFGFLSAFAVIISFFLFRAILRVIISNLYSTIIALVIYILLLYSSYYYSEYDKDLRKSIGGFSIILWIAYFIAIIITYIM